MAEAKTKPTPTRSEHSEAMEKKMATERIKGPASYFPSIEQKYGKPIDYWLNLVRSIKDKKHMEIVALLKADHGLGHGHANAIVAHVMASEDK